MKNYLSTNYGTYILIWLGLISVTLFSVAIAGLNAPKIITIITFIVAVIGSVLVANNFLSVKTNSKIRNVFFVASGIVLLVILFLLVF